MKVFTNLFDNSNWQDAPEYPAGTREKILRNEDNAKTVLLKLPKGFFMGTHSHVSTEQHLLLEGEFTSDGQLFKPGTYQVFAAHEKHGPFESENGALILVVWDPLKPG